MQGLVYIFIALAAVGVAAAAYFGLTFSPIEAIVTAIAFGSVAVTLLERQLRQRSEARLEKTLEDMARMLSSDARAGQVLSQRVNAIADVNVGNRLDGIEADISVLGTVVRQVAEAVADIEQERRSAADGFAPEASDETRSTYAAPIVDDDAFPDPPIPPSELLAALNDDRLIFHIEPIVVLPQRKPLGYDLVPRMRHADGGLAEPVEFMPRRDGDHLIRRIEAMALDEAVVIARRSRTAGTPIRLFSPLSGATLHDELALDQMLVTLSANQAITGTLQMVIPQADWKSLEPFEKRQLIELRKAGVGFVLSDSPSLRLDYGELEGMGFSSVRFDAAHFLNRPQDFTDLHTSDIVPYVSRFAIELCATGVIDEQQLLSLFEDGIKLAQGPYVGRPGPVRPDLVVEKLQAGTSRRAAQV
ncbi:EAL domain-containing protein [Devosia sp.]|uniref:EAL domain-containing protein n=1 Tax=Devosia sp. TaxID=1871048 RepID=UPI003A951BFA